MIGKSAALILKVISFLETNPINVESMILCISERKEEM